MSHIRTGARPPRLTRLFAFTDVGGFVSIGCMGPRVPCPHCKAPVTLRADTCRACGSHFKPVHANIARTLFIIVILTILTVAIVRYFAAR